MTEDTTLTAQCLVCEHGSDDVPLIAFRFRGADLHICSQHLPILIHKPASLADRLPGAESLSGGDHGH